MDHDRRMPHRVGQSQAAWDRYTSIPFQQFIIWSRRKVHQDQRQLYCNIGHGSCESENNCKDCFIMAV